MRADRYEFLVYKMLCDHLDSGDVYVPDSSQFRSFEADLVAGDRWERDKDELIRELNLPILNSPIEATLAELAEVVERLFFRVNRRIQEGENEHIKITGSGDRVSWSLPYKKPEEVTNNPLFDLVPQIKIRDLLAFVDSQSGFMSAFTHILGRYVKNDADDDAIAGAIIALATNNGLYKMAESSDMPYLSVAARTYRTPGPAFIAILGPHYLAL